MKYIKNNIINFIRDNTKFFFIIVITLFLSSVIIHITYGIYRGYEIKKVNVRNSTDTISITTSGNYQIAENTSAGPHGMSLEQKVTMSTSPSENQMCISDIKKFISSFGNSLDDLILNIRAYAVVEDDYFICDFTEKSGKIINNHDYALENLSEAKGSALNSFQSGRFFTDAEYAEGVKVCIAYGFKNKLKGEYNKRNLNADGTLRIGDSDYKIAGVYSTSETPVIPITSLPDDTPLTGTVELKFSDFAGFDVINSIRDKAYKTLGDKASFDFDVEDNSSESYMYRTIVIIIMLITFAAMIDFASVYLFIFSLRRKDLLIYRICGLSQFRSVLLYLFECVTVTVLMYVFSVAVFIYLISPSVHMILKDTDFSYGFRTNVLLFLIYFGISFAVQLVTVLISMRKNVLTEYHD